MAMVKCPECEGKISSEAVFCPHCGYPVAEKTAITEYELETGTPESSGLSTLLSVLAWIAWIGGLILSIMSANVTKTGYYRDETVFSFPTFISLFIPFVVYGAILYGLSVMVQQIADTHGIISGLRLVRKTIEPKKAPEPVVKEKPEIKKMVLPDITVHYNGWKQVNPGVLICPRCDRRSSGNSWPPCRTPTPSSPCMPRSTGLIPWRIPWKRRS